MTAELNTLNLQCQEQLIRQLNVIYQDIPLKHDVEVIACQLMKLMRLNECIHPPSPFENHWSEKDVVMITYGDSIIEPPEKPLQTLKHFLNTYLENTINSVHILPFFPYSSDDGFSVIDYSSVNEALGDWQDIKAISSQWRLMADIVINHCSSRSVWFENFIKGSGQGHDYFFTASLEDDISSVVRPRTSPLLKPTQTLQGEKQVWCTFSHDQVDFDFRNTDVLISFVSIIRQYLDAGIRIFRLDAIAFLWKKLGTKCINLPQTHEIVRLLRTLIEYAQPDAVIITETNIPNVQNLTYFGNANEAHAIYNFSLPPLLINTLITGNCLYLKRWLMSMPPAQNGTSYFNFIASHDGIGLRPAEGILDDNEILTLTSTMKKFGGRISSRTTEDGVQKPYEMNIALIDACKGTVDGADIYTLERFICAHAIMLALEGIPGIYIHSLLGTRNDIEKLKNTHANRAINRHRWQYWQLREQLAEDNNEHAIVLKRLKKLINIRIKQPAFHPNATQFTLHLGVKLFGFWRQSLDRQQSIFCISNITDVAQQLPLNELNLISTQVWFELITGQAYTHLTDTITLAPYETVWISNTPL